MAFTETPGTPSDGSALADRLADVRAEHERVGLHRSDLADDPVVQLRLWWDEAIEAGMYLPDAMALATAGDDHRPSVRFVLVRGLDERGVVFYTNTASRKGHDLAANPWAEGVMAWHPVGRQARVAGRVEPVSDAEADAYWRRRPRGSQLAARASPQSAVVDDRNALERLVLDEARRWEGRDVERPPSWSGYRIVPDDVEFWQARGERLHDRFRYVAVTGDGGGTAWRIERLAP